MSKGTQATMGPDDHRPQCAFHWSSCKLRREVQCAPSKGLASKEVTQAGVAEPEGSQASEDTVWLGKTILAIATLSVPGEHQNALIDVKPTQRGGQWHLLVGVTAHGDSGNAQQGPPVSTSGLLQGRTFVLSTSPVPEELAGVSSFKSYAS